MNTLSVRAQRFGTGPSPMMKNFMKVQKNQYDEQINSNGICNCGVAENYLCENELLEKLKSINVWQSKNLFYPGALGQMSLRVNLCRMFEKFLDLKEPLDPNRMIISSGLSGIISLLGYLLGDPNDLFLVPSPYYTVFDQDIAAMANCKMYSCPTLDQDIGKFTLSVEIFERGYNEAISKGLRPRAIIIVNPQNPLGDVYDEETLRPIFQFAAEKELHVIVDEIYAFSLFDDQPSFQSVFNYSSIVDPERTHFIWSFSKDFSLSGLRVGAIYAGSIELCDVAAPSNFLQIPSTIVQETLAELIGDLTWTEFYIKLNCSRLTNRYYQVKTQLEQLDQRISVRPSRSGFFIWADFRPILHAVTFEEEQKLFETILDHGVYISPGASLFCSTPGWFRIIFSVREKWIDEAFKRLKRAIETYQNSVVSSTSTSKSGDDVHQH